MDNRECQRCGEKLRVCALRFVRLYACDQCQVVTCRPRELDAVIGDLEALGGFDFDGPIDITVATVDRTGWAA